jgi:hypothetical protein
MEERGMEEEGKNRKKGGNCIFMFVIRNPEGQIKHL